MPLLLKSSTPVAVPSAEEIRLSHGIEVLRNTLQGGIVFRPVHGALRNGKMLRAFFSSH